MATGKKETLKAHVCTTHAMIRRLVDDITEEESMQTLGENPNHIKWLTGHLIFTSMLAGMALGGKFVMPDNWRDIFRRGAPAPGLATSFPPMTEVKAALFDLQTKVEQQIDVIDEDALDRTTTIAPNWEDAPIKAVLFFCAHDFYHAGQITMIRRAIGRERSFG